MKNSCIERQGTLFIFSAPSGCGKSSIIKKLIKEMEDIELSVSVTTRGMREGEVDGVDYYFISTEQFNELVKSEKLYEYVDSDFGPKYGTPKEKVDKLLSEGKDVILDLDYPGVVQLRKLAGDRVKTIAFLPPSIKVLRERLVNRKTDSSEVIEKRMNMAEKRIKETEFYDYVVVNDDLDKAVLDVKIIIQATRLERSRLCGLNKFIEKVLDEK